MKIGVFSDVHSNWEALCACLKRLKKEGAQAYICCGDFIGYGPDPEKCVRKIKELPLLACVMGNHDAVFANLPYAIWLHCLPKCKRIILPSYTERLPTRLKSISPAVHNFVPIINYGREIYALWGILICRFI